MGKTTMFCKINERFVDSDVIMEDSEVENHVTTLSPDVGREISENHVTTLSPDVETEISDNHVTKSNLDVSMRFSNHMTNSFENVLQAESKIPQGLFSNSLTYSQSLKINEIQNNIKEAPKLTLRLAPTGLVSEKFSARQPHSNETSIFGNSDTSFSFRKMPDNMLNETRADVADFL
jgi:hypothetical protein